MRENGNAALVCFRVDVLLLCVQDKDTVRAPVALAIVKLLRVLPEASEGLHLTKVLQNVANLLAERLQSTRDGARSVLIDIVKELGPDYMQPVAAVLSAALPARGFTAHVLGYTLHACLQVGPRPRSCSFSPASPCRGLCPGTLYPVFSRTKCMLLCINVGSCKGLARSIATGGYTYIA